MNLNKRKHNSDKAFAPLATVGEGEVRMKKILAIGRPLSIVR